MFTCCPSLNQGGFKELKVASVMFYGACNDVSMILEGDSIPQKIKYYSKKRIKHLRKIIEKLKGWNLSNWNSLEW